MDQAVKLPLPPPVNFEQHMERMFGASTPARTLGPLTAEVREMLSSSPKKRSDEMYSQEGAGFAGDDVKDIGANDKRVERSRWKVLEKRGTLDTNLKELLALDILSFSLPVPPSPPAPHIASNEEKDVDEFKDNNTESGNDRGGESGSDLDEDPNISDATWLLHRVAFKTPSARVPNKTSTSNPWADADARSSPSSGSFNAKTNLGERSHSSPRAAFVGTTRRNTIMGGGPLPDSETREPVFHISKSARRRSLFLRKLVKLAESKSGTNEMLLTDGVHGKPIREGAALFQSIARGRTSMMHHSNAPVGPMGLSSAAGKIEGDSSKLSTGAVMAAVIRANARLNSSQRGYNEGSNGKSASLGSPFVSTSRRASKFPSPSRSPGHGPRGSSSPHGNSAVDFWGSPKSTSSGQGYVLEQVGPKLWLRVHRNGQCDALTSPNARDCIPLDYVSDAEYSWRLTQNGGLRR